MPQLHLCFEIVTVHFVRDTILFLMMDVLIVLVADVEDILKLFNNIQVLDTDMRD